MTQTTRSTCPDCGAVKIPAMGRFYCAHCGWNRDAAERRYVRVQWVLPLLIVIFDFMGIVALGIERHDWPGAILFATLPTLLLGFVYAGVRQGLARMRGPLGSMAANVHQRAATLTQLTDATASTEKSQYYAFLLSLAPPRPVRLNRRGKRVVNLLLLFVFGMEAFLAWTLHGVWYRDQVMAQSRTPEIFLIAFMILIAAVPFFMRRGMVRDLQLMATGAVVIGRVTEQKNFKNSSAVRYEFEDNEGHTINGLANDLTRTFSAGMDFPIFYDAQNPKHHLATCASFFEIAYPADR